MMSLAAPFVMGWVLLLLPVPLGMSDSSSMAMILAGRFLTGTKTRVKGPHHHPQTFSNIPSRSGGRGLSAHLDHLHHGVRRVEGARLIWNVHEHNDNGRQPVRKLRRQFRRLGPHDWDFDSVSK